AINRQFCMLNADGASVAYETSSSISASDKVRVVSYLSVDIRCLINSIVSINTLLRQVNQNDLALTFSGDLQLRDVGAPSLIAQAQLLPIQNDLAVNHVNERAPARLQLVRDALARAEARDIKRHVLMNLYRARRVLTRGYWQQRAGALLGRKPLLLI